MFILFYCIFLCNVIKHSITLNIFFFTTFTTDAKVASCVFVCLTLKLTVGAGDISKRRARKPTGRGLLHCHLSCHSGHWSGSCNPFLVLLLFASAVFLINIFLNI
ncbi:hypothetical protein DNTS_032829 [Danionella cerebrum]|uniref:Uncharacterized protein n=1 Tax=Danionella cerebrum TaxID=2873325 RepID=A0A553RE23_9TELE|nr:hypothetical protein DNTS_032829 [Danionella translucida]